MLFRLFKVSLEKVNITKFGGKNMESNQTSGIVSIILGLIFIIFPLFSSGIVSIMIGVSLVVLGIASILSEFSAFNIIVGILAIIFGLLFIFNIDALSFLLGLQFYIIGILLILLGISGLFAQGMSKIASILIVILGIVSFALGGLSIDNPLFAAIIIGVALIAQGIRLYIA